VLQQLPGLLSLLALGFAVYFVAVTLFTWFRLTHPPRRTYAWAVSRGVPGDPGELPEAPEWTTWRIKDPPRSMEVWDVTGGDPEGPVLLFLHGWSDGRVGTLPRIPAVLDRCSRVLAFNLPRQGERQDKVSLSMGAHEHRDVRCVLEAAQIAGKPLVIFGWSMGAGIAMDAAVRMQDELNILGLILEAPYRDPFTPARNVLHLAGIPWRGTLRVAIWLIGVRQRVGPKWRGFDRVELARRLRVPAFVFHGDEDETCPFEHGERIAEACPDAEFVRIPGGHHIDLWTDEKLRPLSTEAVRTFLDRLRSAGAQPA